ncbi:carbohydrate ABC transporter permease [Paenibacillus sp. GP183]|jgi:ABC-type glycerol-3-phosphate transport system permease component|uniref:carbohydrate ABC transporter permease n=1 Tax=Paenibacillus sp. GP183 TaxID=1882751 RepID=UPI000898ACEB|nr:carbohydrate ABC transporter permease [Paenibacillus sp. GP183]SEB85232.1 carbohydrate ABC transporter membrane protein 2, CUT1 family [Paenibacillus sp. GP183]
MRSLQKVQNTLLIAFLSVLSLFMALPFIWMFVTSFKAYDEVFVFPPQFIPAMFHWSNYADVMKAAPFARYFGNSVSMTILITILQLLSSVLAAYAFARMSFKGRQTMFLIVLSTMMVPIYVTFIPNFLIIKQIGIFNTYWALIVPFCASAFGIFMMRQAFLQVPKELEEAATLDGCNHMQIIWHVMLPLSMSPILTFGLLSIIWHYNDFFWPLVITNSEELRTLQVGLASMISEEGGGKGTQWNLVMAASSLIIFPLIILFLMVQKHIVRGIATTGIK